ncbi:MAG: PEP-utilizing enzyme [Limisphaerales bacterium]
MSDTDLKSSFEQQMPSAFQQLVEAGKIAEQHFRDVCDMEFTVQNDQLFINAVRPGKRSQIANVRFALQFLAKGKIGPQDVLRRVPPSDIAAWLLPVIENGSALRIVGNGLPACPGVATGKVVFRASDAVQSAAKKTPVILARKEVSPEDFRGMLCAEGVLTTRGGVSSHAALVSREMGKPCVCGYSPKHALVENDGDVRSLFQAGTPIPMPHAYTEHQLVEQPSIGLYAELDWQTMSLLHNIQQLRDLLLSRLMSGQFVLSEN